MQLISSNSFDYSSVRMETLFTEMIELFTETGNGVVSGQVDALEQAAMGNGEWGICDGGEEDGLGIWLLAEEGTLVLYSSGAIAKFDFDFDEADYLGEDAEGDDKYDLFYNLLKEFLPEDVIPDKLPFDEDAEGEKLSNDVSEGDESDDNDEDE